MDIFKERKALPMLLKQGKVFDNENYIYEMKFDGFRTIIYLDNHNIEIRSRNNKDVTNLYPELKSLINCSQKNCILDGELIVMGDNGPDFFKMQKRGRLKIASKIKQASIDNPVCFIAFDILYYDKNDLTNLPLFKRKEYLDKYIKENDYLIKTKYIKKEGKKLFNEIKKKGLEGVVAKKIDSPYLIGKRVDFWVKFKAIKEEDFFILGYKVINQEIKTILIGKKLNNKIIYYGEVNFPNKDNQEYLENYAKSNQVNKPYFPLKNIIWLKLSLKATIRFKEVTASNNLRHATFMKFV